MSKLHPDCSRHDHPTRSASRHIGLAALLAAALSLPEAAMAQNQRLAYVGDTAKTAPVPQAAPPLLSLISLNRQRMYVYDANGFVVQSRVSTGTVGYDTPKGIYSVIQKKVEHTSNIYLGASMPHMQRLLWSGIAMHAGEVPRYAASHGCIRLPHDFAQSFFGMTALNTRVIIVPDVQAPVRISHPALFSALPAVDTQVAANSATDDGSMAPGSLIGGPTDGGSPSTLAALGAARQIEKDRIVAAELAAKAVLDTAATAAESARLALIASKADIKTLRLESKRLAGLAEKTRRIAVSAESRLAAQAKDLAARAPRMRADKLLVLSRKESTERSRVAILRTSANAATDELKAARSAVTESERLIDETEAAAKATKAALAQAQATSKDTTKALEDFQLAERNRPKPVSVFVSSRTGMVSVRQGFEPITEAEASITGNDRRLGTFVFTATRWRDDSRTALDWNVVSVDETGLTPPKIRNSDANVLPRATDVRRAMAALDRIRIPADVHLKIAEVVKPGSSLIISDYDMARSEVGKGTDFIVQMPEVIARKKDEAIASATPRRNTRYARAWRNTWRETYQPVYRPYYKPQRYQRYRSIFDYGYDD
ncbi:MAG: L,D-transpeptidase family protein [Hyphomicrobium sp.]